MKKTFLKLAPRKFLAQKNAQNLWDFNSHLTEIFKYDIVNEKRKLFCVKRGTIC